MDKLIKMKQVPIFNQDGIKKGMFMTVQNKGCDPINGIISLVTEQKIYYYDRGGCDSYVLISSVTEGTTQIQVADGLNLVDRMFQEITIDQDVNTGNSFTAKTVNPLTFNKVTINGVEYVRKINFNTITTDSVKSTTTARHPNNLY